MTDIEKLLAIEAIKQLKARYYRFLDTKQWDDLAQVFATDAVFDARQAMSNVSTAVADPGKISETWRNEGREAIIAFIRERTGPASTVHHGHMPEIEIIDADHARGIVAMEDQNRYFGPDGGMTSRLHGWGHYHEEYVREDGAWRIHRSVLTRLRVDLEIFRPTPHP
ncbi:MAG: nuclear transport factor 2 family protein [Sphingomonadales bacterium]|nr:MAG: nuclear transport factor 2 family protein [Sphingomonadales bacterium]